MARRQGALVANTLAVAAVARAPGFILSVVRDEVSEGSWLRWPSDDPEAEFASDQVLPL